KNIKTSRLTGAGSVQEKNSFNFTTLATSFNVGRRWNEHWKMNGTFTISNRAPHVNELLSNGIHHGTASYEEGNIFLQEERSFNFSFNTNFSSENGKLLVEAGLYNNNVRNFIYLQPKPDEPVLTIAG